MTAPSGQGADEQTEPPGGGPLAPQAEREQEGEEPEQALQHRHRGQGQDHLGAGDGPEGGEVPLLVQPPVRRRGPPRPGRGRVTVGRRCPTRRPRRRGPGQLAHRQAGAGHHRGHEHRGARPEHGRGTAQLEDGHGRQGEHEPGQRGQQAQPGVERGQVGLDHVLAGHRVVDVDDRRGPVGRGVGSGVRGLPGSAARVVVRVRRRSGRRPARPSRGRPSRGPAHPW